MRVQSHLQNKCSVRPVPKVGELVFWKRIDIETPQEQREDLRQALADRLMVALDFATLGAYELSGPDVATERDAQRRAGLARRPRSRARRSCDPPMRAGATSPR